jgi:hypothetical protein
MKGKMKMNNQENTLIVKTDKHYGKNYIYPSCEKSELVAKLWGEKTFSKERINILKELGFKFIHKQIEI